MNLRISQSDGTPIYLQIVNQVKYLIASGQLKPHDEVPPVRTLAERLIINPNTVARAYRELEVAGLLYKRQGAGTYVAESSSPLGDHERLRILTERTDALLVEARHFSFSLNQVIDLIRRRDAVLNHDGEER
jgi:GntR family transcriptional regulator